MESGKTKILNSPEQDSRSLDFGTVRVPVLFLQYMVVPKKWKDSALPKPISEIPISPSGRIRWVAEILYPEGRWRADIARALGIGRSTLYRYLGRKRPARGIDDSLALLMARERIAAHGRGREIAKAERSFSRAMGRAPSPASKDSK
jgi:Helix-turn-helix domain of resolvase